MDAQNNDNSKYESQESQKYWENFFAEETKKLNRSIAVRTVIFIALFLFLIFWIYVRFKFR